MAKIPVEVTFETITPLWTGDAWGEMNEIRPSALIGNLRFWFEVLMYFGGVLEEKYFDREKGRFEREFKKELVKKFKESIFHRDAETKALVINPDKSFQLKILAEKLKLPISSIIFGTTGWRSLIEIKGIEYLEDYCFGNRLNLPYVLAFKKTSDAKNEDKKLEIFKEKRDYQNWIMEIECNDCKTYKDKERYAKKQYSIFYFPQYYFWGKFKVKFSVEQIILEPIFYPLLNFMHHYGYWGGKWNLGFGRLRILDIYYEDKQNKKKAKINMEEYKTFNLSLFKSSTESKKKNYKSNNYFLNWKELVKIIKHNFKDFEIIRTVLNADKFYCSTEKFLEKKVKTIPTKILIIEFNHTDTVTFDIIKNLLQYKIKVRDCLRHICEFKNNESELKKCFENDETIKDKTINCKKDKKVYSFKCEEIPKILNKWKTFRHYLLGEKGEGSKILPYISADGKYGFLSIAGLLNLQQNNKRSKK